MLFRSSNLTEPFESDDRIGIGFGSRGKYRPDRNVADGHCEGAHGLWNRVGRVANGRVRAQELACRSRGEIFLPEMNAVSPGKQCNVHAVIDDDSYVVGVTIFYARNSGSQEFAARRIFIPNLDKRGAAFDKTPDLLEMG